MDPCANVRGSEIVGGDLVFAKRDRCYRKQAETTGDVKWCRKSRVTGRNSGYDVRCVINVARSTGDPAICDSLTEGKSRDRSQCVFEVAVEKQVPGLCPRITDGYYRKSCVDRLVDRLIKESDR